MWFLLYWGRGRDLFTPEDDLLSPVPRTPPHTRLLAKPWNRDLRVSFLLLFLPAGPCFLLSQLRVTLHLVSPIFWLEGHFTWMPP